MKQALYLQYRPSRFADLAGQEPIVKTLQSAIAAERVAHAYLFTGPRGTGKTTTARLLAKGVNCLKPAKGEPDDSCELCVGINEGSALDIIEVDAASNRGIDEIRELRDKVHYAPTKATRKVYIIDEVHMLTKEAFNALLKTLEEPPEHALFILATTEPHKVPQTIISRCQRFDFRPATAPLIAKHLGAVAKQEGLTLDKEAAELLAVQARGSFRDGLSILDLLASLGQTTITPDLAREMLGLANLTAVASLERALVAGDQGAAIAVIKQAAEQGIAAETFRQALIDYLRTLMLAKAGAPAPKKAGVLAADWELRDLTAAVRSYLETADLVQSSATPELPLEIATLELLDRITARPTPAASAVAPPNKPTVQSGTGVPEKSAESAGKPPAAANELWDRLLVATKGDYSLSVSLQKTRPTGLTADTFELAVISEFFLKKLADPKTQAKVEEHCAKILGRPIAIKTHLAAPDEVDIFDGVMQVFEGAKVE